MNDKFVYLIFLIIWSCGYYFGINSLTEKYYEVKQIKVHNENIINKDKTYKIEYFTMELENNQTCYLGVKNTEKIKEYIDEINRHKNKYYSNLYHNLNKNINNCSEPNTTVQIYFDFLIINLETLIVSFILTFVIVNIFKDITELQEEEQQKNITDKIYDKIYDTV